MSTSPLPSFLLTGLHLSFRGVVVSYILGFNSPLSSPSFPFLSIPFLLRLKNRMFYPFSSIRLLDNDGDPLALDASGCHSLYYCIRDDRQDCVLAILMRHPSTAPISTTAQRHTPMHVACRFASTKCLQLLSRWDADSAIGQGLLDREDGQGKKPLQLMKQRAGLGSSLLDNLWTLCRRGDAGG